MKHLLLTIALIVVGPAAFAQGTVNFSNATSAYGSAVPDHLVRWSIPIPPAFIIGGLVASNSGGLNMTGLRAQLFYGASTINSPASLTAVTDAPATFRASTSANVGSWLGGTRTLWGFNPGDTVHLNIIVWNSDGTSDPLQAFDAGMSGIFNYTIPAAGSPPSAYLPSGQLPFVYPGVPEPGSLTLIAIGGMALWLWRRSKNLRRGSTA